MHYVLSALLLPLLVDDGNGVSGANAGMLADVGSGANSSCLNTFFASAENVCDWLLLRHDDWKSDSVNS